MPSRRRKALATSTIAALDGLEHLSDALEKARAKYAKDLIGKRPPDAITVREFIVDYNKRARKQGFPPMAQRTAEGMFQRWVRTGEYQRAPMLIVGPEGRPRRTYVYWETTR